MTEKRQKVTRRKPTKHYDSQKIHGKNALQHVLVLENKVFDSKEEDSLLIIGNGITRRLNRRRRVYGRMHGHIIRPHYRGTSQMQERMLESMTDEQSKEMERLNSENLKLQDKNNQLWSEINQLKDLNSKLSNISLHSLSCHTVANDYGISVSVTVK